MASGTVTIEKAYFETLLRRYLQGCQSSYAQHVPSHPNFSTANKRLAESNRAQFHSPGTDFTTPPSLETVTILKSNHDNLLTVARQFENLQQNLYRGGIAQETLDILIQDDSAATESQPNHIESGFEETSDAVAMRSGEAIAQGGGTHHYTYTRGPESKYPPRVALFPENNNYHIHSPLGEDFQFGPDDHMDGFYHFGSGHHAPTMRTNRQQHEKFAKRTVLLTNLPEGTTHAEIVDVVRGGMLLDLYLRAHDRTASVSFLEEAAAQDFFRHVKRHDLYIKGKRVDIRWNERQFILPGHVSNKISIGATRNLVIHNCTYRHTEEAIRDDLEHIHNLAVIKVSFKGTDAYVSTNSVHNAMFGRTCLMSRVTYKGCKIEWDVDECADPLRSPLAQLKDTTTQKKKADAPIINRFQLLNMDGTDEGSSDEDDQGGISFQSSVSPIANKVAA